MVDWNHMNDTISKPVSSESHNFIYWLQTWPYKHLLSWWCHLHSIYFIFCCLCGFVCDCLAWNWRLWIIIWFLMVWPCFMEVLWEWILQSCDNVTSDDPSWFPVWRASFTKFREKWSKPRGFLMCHHLVWKFSFAISCVIQHPAVVPYHWLLSHSTTISLLWHLFLNWALQCHPVIFQNHTSLKLLILLRIMSPFKGTLSFPSFTILMIIKVFITPKNLLFHLW